MRKRGGFRFYFNDDSAVDELINEMNDWIAARYLMKRFGCHNDESANDLMTMMMSLREMSVEIVYRSDRLADLAVRSINALVVKKMQAIYANDDDVRGWD